MIEDIVVRLQAALERHSIHRLGRVINATGIVLHTNLGRAPLPERAIKAVEEAARGYSNLEFDLESGGRGSRYQRIRSLITSLTGAESSLVVNNNAAAVFLSINTLAAGKEVIVSRGQQVEIGGSFRIPDVIRSSGARMVEVGTTNKTRLQDYESAITENTAILLKVHTSNFKLIGFTSEVPLKDMVELARQRGLIAMEDLGSGTLLDLASLGLPYEPTVRDSLKAGVDIVTFSGDKLLGGPQAGIIIGRKDLVDRIARNPLMRALRVDKMTLAALEEVLRIYHGREEDIISEIPALRFLSRSPEDLELEAQGLARRISQILKEDWIVQIVDDPCEAGGGSLPGAQLPGKAVAIARHGPSSSPTKNPEANLSKDPGANLSRDRGADLSVEDLHAMLRLSSPPVISRLHGGQLLLNVRTLFPEDPQDIVTALSRIVGGDKD